jgi:transcriptional regulator with XRE-family HTH domain
LSNAQYKGGENMAAEKLREMINDRGLKQKYIAEKIGVSETALSAMLNGNQKIDVDTFFAIDVILRMSPDEIMAFKKGA